MQMKPLKFSVPVLDQDLPNGLRAGNAVEISGSSSSGKTEFLMHSNN